MTAGLDYVIAWQEICQHVTKQDIDELGELDETDLAGALIGLLVDAEVQNPEALLIRAGILE